MDDAKEFDQWSDTSEIEQSGEDAAWMWILFSVVRATSLIGNGYLVFQFLRISSIKNDFSLVITSVTITDLICTFAEILSVLHAYNRKWKYGTLICKTLSLIDESTYYIHLYLLVGMSLIYSILRTCRNYIGMKKSSKYVYIMIVGCLVFSITYELKATEYFKFVWIGETRGLCVQETGLIRECVRFVINAIVPIATLISAGILFVILEPKVASSILKHINEASSPKFQFWHQFLLFFIFRFRWKILG